MTVVDFVAFVRRNWTVLVAAVVLGVLAMAVFSLVTPKIYESRSSGFVIASNDGSSADALSGAQTAIARANAYLPLIASSAVYKKIEANPDANPGGDPLSGRLTASVASGSTLIEVTAAATTPEDAVALANGALAALAEVITEIETQTSADKTPQIIVVPLEDAVPASTPTTPNWTTNLLIGAAAGLVLGFAFAFLRRALDIRVRTADELTELFGVGVLGRIPKAGKAKPGSKKADAGVHELTSEAFRALRTSLRFSSVDQVTQSIVITSANQAEGKSTIAAGLARVTAESGQPTILVDADLRRPAVTRMLGIDGAVGLSEVLSQQISVADAIRPTNTPNLFALPSGRIPPNPSEMLSSTALRTLIAELSQTYFVIVDAPPVLPVTDASIVGTVVDGIVFVVASGRTRRPEVSAARRILHQVHGRALGTVLNMVTAKDGDSGYYYYYRRDNYTYEQQADASPQVPKDDGPRQRGSSASAQPAPLRRTGAVRTRASQRSDR